MRTGGPIDGAEPPVHIDGIDGYQRSNFVLFLSKNIAFGSCFIERGNNCLFLFFVLETHNRQVNCLVIDDL